jgi:hypothetical protein
MLAVGLALVASAAQADPCEAPVRGYKPGDRLVGLVWYAGDGDSLCIGQGSNPTSWIEIREARWFAPELHEPGGREAKRVMDSLVGKRAVCTVERGQGGRTHSYDRVIAACRVHGRLIADIMAAAGVRPGGRGAPAIGKASASAFD